MSDSPLTNDSARETTSVEELARQVQAGSTEPFRELVARFEAPVHDFLRLRTGSREDAEELTQETFLRAWRKIDRYDPRYRFSTWLFTLARRIAVSHQRRQGAWAWLRRREQDAPELEELGEERDPGHALTTGESERRIWDLAAQTLSPEQRSALWLRYAEDLPMDEIGRILGRRRESVRLVLFRARRKLADRLGPELPAGRRPTERDPARPTPGRKGVAAGVVPGGGA